MSPARKHPHPALAAPVRDRGSITLFGALAALALLVTVGLAVDGGAKIRALQRADAYAEEAARAGGQAINAPLAIQGDPAVLEPAAAREAAERYLRAAGIPGSVRVTSATTIEVQTTITRPTVFLGLIGIDTVTAHGQAVARVVRGVTGEDQ
jgi:hypothetical protein